MMKTPEIERAAALAESLRAMRRNARHAYVSARPGACHSITMDSARLSDLTDAADLIERQAAELAALRAKHAAKPEPVPLSDDRIDAIADLVIKGMPDGIGGFVRGWGWQHFARELLDVCAGHYRAPDQAASYAQGGADDPHLSARFEEVA